MSRAVTSIIIVALVFAFLIVTILFFTKQDPATVTVELPSQVSWNLEAFTPVQVSLSGNTILLNSDCSQVSILTSSTQAAALDNAIEKRIGKRPLTHDVAADSLEFFDVEVIMAKVTRMEAGTYYASLVLQDNSNVLEIDSRPSDAIAFAVRSSAPVYVSNTLLEQGNWTC
ncbi:bifunctional nuclease family protein [archaeon]|nr:bifunctional nuclease family protein [archaeon]